LVLSLALLIGAIAAPASATKPGTDPDLVNGHKIWICHATSSLSNPYVKILIDIAAWDIENPDSNDHGPLHHLRSKGGITWGDYALESADDTCSLPPPPDEGEICPATGVEADFIVYFYGVKLRSVEVRPDLSVQTVAADIPAGTYDATLVSGDHDRGGRNGVLPYQPNERWRLAGSSPSGFSTDLPDVGDPITGFATSGLSVTFNSDVTSVTAQHWSVVYPDGYDSSVIPEYVCLTAVGAQSE
jgi:hypothetical protein